MVRRGGVDAGRLDNGCTHVVVWGLLYVSFRLQFGGFAGLAPRLGDFRHLNFTSRNAGCPGVCGGMGARKEGRQRAVGGRQLGPWGAC
jgi:hypothetical protein